MDEYETLLWEYMNEKEHHEEMMEERERWERGGMDEFDDWIAGAKADYKGTGLEELVTLKLVEYQYKKFKRRMTCKMGYLDEPTAFYKCSECGAECCENCAAPPNYCPNCGRRVVEEKE